MTILIWLLIFVCLVNALIVQSFWPEIAKWQKDAETLFQEVCVKALCILCYVGPIALGFIAGLLVVVPR